MSNYPPPPNGSSAVVPAVAESAETEKPQGRNTGAIVGAVIGGLVLIALVAWLLWLGLNNPDGTRWVRDVAIIFLSLMSTLVVASLVILIILVSRLVIMLQVEIKPLLESLQETTQTLRGTATFMSENMVKPVINTAGYAEGARRFLEVLVGLRPRKPKKQP